ncbi:uncharacterized protein LOC110834881 [Zootermopsis nevadensis]|uniref:Ionotropic glutamate receptor C-terminal domain-containing protein n=1 Tax=Zootermopsis nevadensis TaxID=136037 RepID=A0A067R6W7_ZOONE|nr:uncharacterized protein LOC110834881 [Zootermopsis nevadensis]KDR14037.1 hypothetical protein L798_11949 [Zootermopsis nevadensis]
MFTLVVSVLWQTPTQVQQQMVQCLNDISLKHFTPVHALVVAYYNSQLQESLSRILENETQERNKLYWERDFGNKLLQDLHKSEKWSLLLYLNNDKWNEEMPQSKHGSYIIISLHHHHKNVVQDVSVQIKKLRNDWDWNPRAKFIITLPHAEGNSTKQLAADVFNELWRWRVINMIAVIPALGPKNTTDAVPVLDVYTWFPYRPPGRCADVRDPVVLDHWIVDKYGNGSFLNNATLFPEKVPKDLQGCPIVASLFELEPAVMSKKFTTEDSAKTVFNEGIEIRLLQEFGSATNMTITYTQPPNEELWGLPLKNGSWTGASGQLIQGSVDMAMDLYFYRCDVIKEVECLTPHLIDHVRWYVPCASPFPGWMSLIRVFTLSLWLGFLVSYFIVAFIMWQVVKKSNMIFTQSIENQGYTSLVKCLMNFWAIILGESVPNNPPEKPVIRMVFLIWVLYCLAINTVYQTYLTSFLVDPGLQHQISSDEEVINSGMEYGVPSAISTVIPHVTNCRYQHLLQCDDHKGCQNRIAFKRDFSYIYSTFSMEFIIAARYTDANGKQLICSFEEIILSQLITMPVPKGYMMLDRFNSIILHLLQAGILEQWFKDIKYTTSLSSRVETDMLSGEYTKLSLLHMQSAVYILLLGLFLSFAVFLLEMLLCMNLRFLYP